ncbi:phosphopantetheine-binding protein [Streptomyces sp. NPDC015184]|uniref:phosphopantetheine-binding protein n=1 Tax=Streptomyces sp. NPDC015184 TaxID=3364946 RepID=UPI0036F625F8
MPHERQNSLRADVIAPPPDAMTEAVVTEVVVVLADVLRLKPEKIDPEQTFRSLGLDSLLTVEFVATVNARYGTAVRAAALLDHPTPLAFTRHLVGELGARDSATGAVPPSGARGPAAAQGRGPAPAMPGTAVPMPVVPVPEAVSVPVPPSGGPLPPTASSMPGAREILDHLREELARILCCDPWDIDPTAAFNLLGVDSIIGAQFMAVINNTYGMEERPVALYEHPSLSAMAAHIALATTRTATAAPTTGAMPAPVAEPVAEAEDPGLRALLDAVRDDRLSVDEALTLLPRRA